MQNNFVYLKDIAPTIKQDIKYASTDNFTGTIVAGYIKAVAIAKIDMAQALAKAQEDFRKEGVAIKVFDTYRPLKACQYFQKWAAQPCNPGIKKIYYPFIDKKDLIGNYIKEKSIHSQGYAVDLTLLDNTGKELDMGTIFDYFGPLGHTNCQDISQEAKQNRTLFHAIMKKHGFASIPKEWWHFNFVTNQINPQYYDFEVI